MNLNTTRKIIYNIEYRGNHQNYNNYHVAAHFIRTSTYFMPAKIFSQFLQEKLFGDCNQAMRISQTVCGCTLSCLLPAWNAISQKTSFTRNRPRNKHFLRTRARMSTRVGRKFKNLSDFLCHGDVNIGYRIIRTSEIASLLRCAL